MKTLFLAKSKTKKEMVWHYYEEDYLKLIFYFEEIRWRLAKNEDVPAAMIKAFLGNFEAPFKAEATARSKEILKAKDATVKYFSGKGDYSFKVTRQEPDVLQQHFFGEKSDNEPVKLHKVVYNLEIFLNSIFSRLVTPKDYGVTKDKYKLASFIYDNFNEYIKPLSRPPISEHAMIVVTGFILVQFGYLLTEERWAKRGYSYRYYNDYLYDNLKRLGEKKKK